MILPIYPKVRFGEVLNPKYLSSGSLLSQKAHILIKNVIFWLKCWTENVFKKAVAIILVTYTKKQQNDCCTVVPRLCVSVAWHEMTLYVHSSQCTMGRRTGRDILRMAVMVLALRTDQHRFSQPTSSYRNRKPTAMCTTSVCCFNMPRQDEIFSLRNRALKSKGEMWHKIKKQNIYAKKSSQEIL